MVLILNPNSPSKTPINLSEFDLFIGNRHLHVKEVSGDLVIENIPIISNSKSRRPFHISNQPFRLQIFK